MRIARAFLFLLVSIVVVGSLSNRVHNLSRAQAGQSSGPTCCGPTAPQQLDFAYYCLRDGSNSTLTLVSASPQPLTVTVAVHSRSGQTVTAPPVALSPQQDLSVDLGGVLAGLDADISGDFSDGSVSVQFNGTPSLLGGNLTMVNTGLSQAPGSAVVDNSAGVAHPPAALNGLWWGLGAGQAALIRVANTSGSTAVADVTLDFQGGRHQSPPLTFAPFETKVLSVTDLLGSLNVSPAQASSGGISIVGRGVTQALIAQGLITDPTTTFSSPLHFPDLSLHKVSALHASGVPIGTPSQDSLYAGTGSFIPHAILRNLTGVPQTVQVTVEYPGPQGPQQRDLTPISLAAFETKDIPLDAALGALPTPIPYCSIRIQYSGPPSSVIGEVASLEQTSGRIVGSNLVNEGNNFAGSGTHAWRIDDQTDSIVFLTNMGGADCPMGFLVQANGVTYHVANLSLKAHETRALSLRQLVNSQKADLGGSRIPASATDGSLTWTRLKNLPVMGHLDVIAGGDLVSSDAASGCCCPPNFDHLEADPGPSVDMLPGQQQQYTSKLWTRDCNDNLAWTDWSSYTSWSSTIPTVATVSGSGLATAISGGTTDIVGDGGEWEQNMCCAGNCTPCDQVQVQGESTLTVHVPQYAVLGSSNSYNGFCGTFYAKGVERLYDAYDTNYQELTMSLNWTLNEKVTSPTNCGMGTDGSDQSPNFLDTIYNCQTGCTFKSNQYFTITLPSNQVVTLKAQDCHDPAFTTCPAHTGWQVTATTNGVTVTDN